MSLGVGDLDALLLLGALLAGDCLRAALGDGDLLTSLRFGFVGDRVSLELGDGDTLLPLGLLLALHGGRGLTGHADDLLTIGQGLSGGAIALLLGDLDLGAVDRLRRRPLADRHDVAAFIRDVADVHVDQFQADLVNFLRHILVNKIHKFLAVFVDLLNGQSRDHEAKLAEDDVLRLIADLAIIQEQQALRRVVHQRGIRRYTDREGGRHVDANVVERQGAFQRNVDHQRLEAEVGVILEEWQDERAASVETLSRLVVATHPAVLDEYAIAGASLVARGDEHQHEEEDDDHRADRTQPHQGAGDPTIRESAQRH